MDIKLLKARTGIERMIMNYRLMKMLGDDQEAALLECLDRVCGEKPSPRTEGEAKVYNFPGAWQGKEPPKQPAYQPPPKPKKELAIFRVMPDEPFPEMGESDFRTMLQRDGLILHGWEHWKDFKYVEYGCQKSLEAPTVFIG
jgi:hypothetical protein